MKLGGFPERIWRRGCCASPSCWSPACCSRPISRPARRRRRRGPETASSDLRRRWRSTRTIPAQRRVGGLIFLGGWALSSDSARFGAHLRPCTSKTGEVLALSDAGSVFRFPLPGRGPARGRHRCRCRAGPAGRPASRTATPRRCSSAGDELWIAFERHNMVWRYACRDLARAVGGAAGGDARAGAAMPAPRRWSGSPTAASWSSRKGASDGGDQRRRCCSPAIRRGPARRRGRAALPAPAGLPDHRRRPAAGRPAAAPQPPLRPARGHFGDGSPSPTSRELARRARPIEAREIARAATRR